jgi:hypothetical protein
MGANFRRGAVNRPVMPAGDAARILPRHALAGPRGGGLGPRGGGLGRDRPGGDGPKQRRAGPAAGDPQCGGGSRHASNPAGAGLRAGRAEPARSGGLGRGRRPGGPVRHGGDGPEHCSGRCARPRTGWARSPARAAAPRRAAAAPATVAGPLPGRRLRIVDGSAIARPGGKGAGWRLHATYDPVAGRLTDLELTDDRGAESFGRTAWRVGDVALGDRCYARPPALRRLGQCPRPWRPARISWCGPAGRGCACSARTEPRWLGSPSSTPWRRARPPTGRMVAVDYSGQGRRSRGKATFPARRWRQCRQPSSASRRRRRSGRPRPSAASTGGITRGTSCCRSPCGPPAT